MKGEKLRDVIEVRVEPPGWPTYYVVTDSSIHEYTGQTFERRSIRPEGHSVHGISKCLNREIVEVRGDGESAVILMDTMDMIVFDLRRRVGGGRPRRSRHGAASALALLRCPDPRGGIVKSWIAGPA